MFFYCIAMVEKAILAKALKHSRSYATEKLIGYTPQKISKAWTALAEAFNHTPPSNMVTPYILFNLESNDFSY